MNVFIFFLISTAITSSTFAIGRPRGVSIERASLYDGGNYFKCLSTGQPIPLEHVNDDYCDCEDGSDEPGTSACPNGLFYCENKPYKGSYIISSRVNDGICDCCDGSDEYDGTITCENTCEKMFAEIRAAQEEFLKKQEVGYKVKLEYIQQGKRAKDEKLERLSELEKRKDYLVKEKDEAEEKKKAAEAPEKEAKDKHEAAWNAVLEEKKKQKESGAAALAFAELDVNKDGIVDYPEIQNHMEFDIDNDGIVSEEEAKEYLEEREEQNLESFTSQVWPNIKEIYKAPAGDEKDSEGAELTSVDAEPEKSEGQLGEDPMPPSSIPPTIPDDLDIPEGEDNDDYLYDREDDEDEDDDDWDDHEDEDIEEAKEQAERKLGHEDSKPDQDDDEKMPDYDDDVKSLISVADEARSQYNDADRKLKDFEREISDIQKYMDLDMGPEEEFSALKDKCFEFTDREYTYKLCPFEKCSQRPKAGGIETSLGRWGHWYGPKEDKYSAMKYENGQGCWNGPARSCHVNLHCGEDNQVTSASEPSRCEYQFDFTTPALCAQPHAQAHTHAHTEL